MQCGPSGPAGRTTGAKRNRAVLRQPEVVVIEEASTVEAKVAKVTKVAKVKSLAKDANKENKENQEEKKKEQEEQEAKEKAAQEEQKEKRLRAMLDIYELWQTTSAQRKSLVSLAAQQGLSSDLVVEAFFLAQELDEKRKDASDIFPQKPFTVNEMLALASGGYAAAWNLSKVNAMLHAFKKEQSLQPPLPQRPNLWLPDWSRVDSTLGLAWQIYGWLSGLDQWLPSDPASELSEYNKFISLDEDFPNVKLSFDVSEAWHWHELQKKKAQEKAEQEAKEKKEQEEQEAKEKAAQEAQVAQVLNEKKELDVKAETSGVSEAQAAHAPDCGSSSSGGEGLHYTLPPELESAASNMADLDGQQVEAYVEDLKEYEDKCEQRRFEEGCEETAQGWADSAVSAMEEAAQLKEAHDVLDGTCYYTCDILFCDNQASFVETGLHASHGVVLHLCENCDMELTQENALQAADFKRALALPQ